MINTLPVASASATNVKQMQRYQPEWKTVRTALLKLVASFCPVVRHRAFFSRNAVPRYVFKD